MKKIIKVSLSVLFLYVAFSATAQNVVFDSSDVVVLRQAYVNKNYNKPLDKKQLKMFDRLNTAVTEKGNLPIAQVDDDVLEDFIDRYYYDFQEYKRAETNALKFQKVLKKISSTKPDLYLKIAEKYNYDKTLFDAAIK